MRDAECNAMLEEMESLRGDSLLVSHLRNTLTQRDQETSDLLALTSKKDEEQATLVGELGVLRRDVDGSKARIEGENDRSIPLIHPPLYSSLNSYIP